jgi:HlyD family secretion protein
MKPKLLLIPVIVIAVLAIAAYSTGWFRHDSGLQGSGTVEARDIRVGSKVGGRIDKVLVREGDTVEAGQTLITFDDKELLASLAQSQAAAEKAQRGYRPEEIAEARAAAAQAKAEYDQRKNGYRQEDIAAAQADLDRATADEVRSQLDYQRYEALSQKDLVSKQQRDTAEANWKMALAQKENAQHKLDELKLGYRPEEIASAEARYHQT